MAVAHVGAGVVWGITTTSLSKNGTAITGSGTISYTSQSLSRSTDTMEHRNSLGEVTGFTTYNQSQQVEIECIPTASTIAAARTLRDALPVPGDRVTIFDTVDTSNPISGTGGTDYICTASGLRPSNSDKTIFTMTLVRFSGIASYTPTPAS